MATSIRVATGGNPQVVRPHDPLELGNPPAIPVEELSLLGDHSQERVRIVPQMPGVLGAGELLPEQLLRFVAGDSRSPGVGSGVLQLIDQLGGPPLRCSGPLLRR